MLVDELVRCGVREAVLCPGSRSAPLAYALQEADRAGRLRLHVRVDERSAGFLALGLAKVTRVPAVVVTTSGTAVANLHPAVLEAHHGQVPLIVLSADRPPELQGTGANQTTTQPGMFGGGLRWSCQLGAPERRPGQVAAWRSSACRAVAASRGRPGGVPGPVHLNVPLREPLVPTEAGTWPEGLEGRPHGAPWVSVGPRRLLVRRGPSSRCRGPSWWSATCPSRGSPRPPSPGPERAAGPSSPSRSAPAPTARSRTGRCCSASRRGWRTTCPSGSSPSAGSRWPAPVAAAAPPRGRAGGDGHRSARVGRPRPHRQRRAPAGGPAPPRAVRRPRLGAVVEGGRRGARASRLRGGRCPGRRAWVSPRAC